MKGRIFLVSVFIGIILFMVVFSAKPEQLGKTSIENLKAKQVDGCSFYNENNDCVALVTSSVIDVDEVVTSDQSLVEQFLDTNKFLESKFGLETVVLLIDPFGNTVKTSNILNIPSFAVLDSANNILDLNDLKTSFYFISREKITSVNISGDVEFYLDDNIVSKKKIFGSGNTLQNQTMQLFVADSVSAGFSERKDGFGFTFVDEIPKWGDQTDHFFRVVIKNISGDVIKDGEEPKKIQWVGEHVAYELKMKYDDTKLAVISDDHVKLNIKSDSTISTCGLGGQAIYAALLKYGSGALVKETYTSEPALSPDIEIIKNGQSVGTIKGTNSDISGYVQFGPSQYFERIVEPKNGCNKFTTLERNTDYVFRVEGIDYSYKTSLNQENLFVQCSHRDTVIGDSNPNAHTYYIAGFKKKVCESNFGYSKEMILIP